MSHAFSGGTHKRLLGEMGETFRPRSSGREVQGSVFNFYLLNLATYRILIKEMSGRRSYSAELVVNGRRITEVVVDPHYEAKHSEISDELILKLLDLLDGKEFKPEERDGEWEFFMIDQLEYEEKRYRLVWRMRDQCLFIGVINCFRR